MSSFSSLGQKGNPRDYRTCERCLNRFDSTKHKCPFCGQWDFHTALPKVVLSATHHDEDGTILLSDVADENLPRIRTGPWDICFGGCDCVESPPPCMNNCPVGLVRQSVILIGGEPGAGKSTLALQLTDRIAIDTQRETIYVAPEEPEKQIKARAKRLGLNVNKLLRLVPLGSDADLGAVFLARRPSGIVIDSISAMGLSDDDQVTFCGLLKGYAVELDIPIIVISHINKSGDISGLMKMQHAVDTTALLEAIGEGETRCLTTKKNRNGRANLEVFFEMTSKGLIESEGYDDGEEEEDSGRSPDGR